MEVFISNPAIANLIREDKVHQLYSQMQLNQAETKMVTQTQELLDFLRKKIITRADAIQFSNRPDELIRALGEM
jgi:twitching motility protein PilT